VHPGGGGGGIGDALGDGLGAGRGAADEHAVGARLGGPVLGVELGYEPVAVERRADQAGDLRRLLGGHEPGREHDQVGAQAAQLRGSDVLQLDHRPAIAVHLHRRG
jgi:hypothetical protein